MKRILIIEVSPRGPTSASRKVSQKLSTRLRAEFPEARLVQRDLAKDQPGAQVFLGSAPLAAALRRAGPGYAYAVSGHDRALVQ
jgi:anti-sigma factor RsiW